MNFDVERLVSKPFQLALSVFALFIVLYVGMFALRWYLVSIATDVVIVRVDGVEVYRGTKYCIDVLERSSVPAVSIKEKPLCWDGGQRFYSSDITITSEGVPFNNANRDH